jgi:hypothetical protein
MFAEIFIFLVSTCVGFLVVVSGIRKIVNFYDFYSVVLSMQLMRNRKILFLAALTVCLGEIIAGSLLILRWKELGAMLLIALLLMFNFVIAITLMRKRMPSQCHCSFPGSSGRFGWHLCFRNFAIVAALMTVIGLVDVHTSIWMVLFSLLVFAVSAKAVRESAVLTQKAPMQKSPPALR